MPDRSSRPESHRDFVLACSARRLDLALFRDILARGARMSDTLAAGSWERDGDLFSCSLREPLPMAHLALSILPFSEPEMVESIDLLLSNLSPSSPVGAQACFFFMLGCSRLSNDASRPALIEALALFPRRGFAWPDFELRSALWSNPPPLWVLEQASLLGAIRPELALLYLSRGHRSWVPFSPSDAFLDHLADFDAHSELGRVALSSLLSLSNPPFARGFLERCDESFLSRLVSPSFSESALPIDESLQRWRRLAESVLLERHSLTGSGAAKPARL